MHPAINGRRLLCWVLALLASAWLLSTKLQFSYDLSHFLPAPQTLQQQVLLETLQRSNNTRFLYIGLRDADSSLNGEEMLDLAQQALQDSGIFVSVRSATAELELEPGQNTLLQQYRYLLHNEDWSAAALQRQLVQRKNELQFLNGESFTRLLSRDPGLSIRSLLRGLQARAESGAQETWRSADGYHLLLAETAAPAFDIEAQQRAYKATLTLLAALPELRNAEIKIAGIGAISAQMANMIRNEAMWRSSLASVLLLLVLLIAYRKPLAVLVAGLPLATACVAAVALLSVLFPAVHGITLAFGFTLLGVAIDYPLHLLSHARHQPLARAASAIWPTLRLGLLSTVLVYLAMAVSGSSGLMQLGIFTAAGIVAAALSTRYLLPLVMPTLATPSGAHAAVEAHNAAPTAAPLTAGGLSFYPIAGLLVATFLAAGLHGLLSDDTPAALWTNDLSALSPVPEEQLTLDRQFRTAIGAADARYSILLNGDDLETVLRRTEQLDAALETAAAEKRLAGWTAATRILPSVQTQNARRGAIPARPVLRERVALASCNSGFAATAFDGFIEDAQQSRQLPPLDYDRLVDTAIGDYLRAHLYAVDGEWRSLFTLYAVDDPTQLERWLAANAPGATLLDFKASSEQLVQNYRRTVLLTLTIALLLVGLGLAAWVALRRALWCLAIVCCVLPCTAWLLYLAHGALDLYHLISLMLVAGLGLDYTLFRSRPAENIGAAIATRHAVAACAASTVVVFATLGLSDIPALRSMGQCVALGSLLCYLLASLGAKQ